MERPQQLVLVRHAESARNEAKRGNVYFADDEARKNVLGIPDHQISLTDLGKEQAVITGQAIRDEFGTFDYIYNSGYLRTVQTTDGILEAYTTEEQAAIKVRRNAFIRERDPGYTYEMTEPEVEAAFPWLKSYWETFGGFMARPPGGESLADVVNRVHTFLDMLFRDRREQKIMVVTHGGTLRCFRYLLERWDYEQAVTWNNEQHPVNCGVTDYDYDQNLGRLVLQNYNRTYY